MPDKPEKLNSKRFWKDKFAATSVSDVVASVAAVAAIVAAGAAIFSHRQAGTLNKETAFLQDTQHRISTCIAISQHHYAMWERDKASGWNEEISLIISGREIAEDGQPILMSTNYERANKAIGLARQLALCTSSDLGETRRCIESLVDNKTTWDVNDDNVGEGDPPRQGSQNPVC